MILLGVLMTVIGIGGLGILFGFAWGVYSSGLVAVEQDEDRLRL